jgi:predicted phosphodiesterase
MARINLLHISDLHIAKFPERKEFSPREFLSPGNFKTTARQGTYAASYSTGKLSAVVSLAHKIKDSLDAIVITGDIATTGLEHDLEKARIFIEGPPDPEDPRLSREGIATISGVGVSKLILLPGNHDRYHEWRDPSGLVSLGYTPGNKKFHQVFHRHWQNDVKATLVEKDGLAVMVCAADFSLRRRLDAHLAQPANWHAQGRIYRESEDVLPKLVSHTQAARADCLQRDVQVVIIWALHFPPAFPNSPSYMKLLDEEYLIAAAKECGVACFLVGHTHKQVAYPLPDSTYVLCTGSASQADVKNGNYCQIISIDNANQDTPLKVETYRLEAKNNRLEFAKVPIVIG